MIEIIVRSRPGQVSKREIAHTANTHLASDGAARPQKPKLITVGYHHLVQLPQSSPNRRRRKKR